MKKVYFASISNPLDSYFNSWLPQDCPARKKLWYIIEEVEANVFNPVETSVYHSLLSNLLSKRNE